MTAGESVAGSPRRSVPRNTLGLVVSAVSLAGFVWWAAQQDRPSLPAEAGDVALLALAIAVYGLVTSARGWRWHAVLENAGVRHCASDAYGLTAVGYMGNTVLPLRGGELLRILLMADRSGCRRRDVLGSVVAERFLDAATLIVVLLALSFSGLVGSGAGREIALVGIAVGLGLLAAAMLYKHLRRRGMFSRFADLVRPVAHASRALANRRGAVLAAVTLGIWCLEAVVFWLVARSVHAEVTLFESLFVVVFISVVIAVPAGPGYVGTLDASLVFVLGNLDVTGSTALAVVLLYRFVLFVPITVAGFVLLVTRYGGLSQIRARPRPRPA